MYYKEVRWKENAIKTSVPFSDTFISSSPYSIFRIFFQYFKHCKQWACSVWNSIFSASLYPLWLCSISTHFQGMSRKCPVCQITNPALPVRDFWEQWWRKDESRWNGQTRKVLSRSISSISGRFYISSHKRMILALLCMADPHLFV